MSAEGTRRLAAILAADVVGYSRLISADEVGTLAQMRGIWSGIFNPTVAQWRGHIFKMMGDGALVEFGSALDAVQCALDVQGKMAARNAAEASSPPIVFRIGVNLGDVVIESDDIFGDGVIVAVRLESNAPAGGVLVADSVHAQARGRIDVAFADAGEIALKNIERPVRAWCWGGQPPGLPSSGEREHAENEKPSLAILPFFCPAGDAEQDAFAEGLADDITTTLSRLSGLVVIAHNSTASYKGRIVDFGAVARELNVRYVLEGSVRKAGTRVRITAKLIDTKTGAHVWANRYDRKLDDIFKLQDEITLILATEMQVSLIEGEQARLRYTTTNNVEAWDNWVRGLSHFRSPRSETGYRSTRQYWERALALDPESAALNAALAFIHYTAARSGWWETRPEALRLGMNYVERALALDPCNPDAHTSASLLLMVQRRHDEAVAEARRAVDLGPGSADVAVFASFVLANSGFPEEALAHAQRAMKLSPKHMPAYFGLLGHAYRLTGRSDDAIAAFKAFGERSPGSGLTDLVLIYAQTARMDEAKATAQQLLTAQPKFTVKGWADTQFRSDEAQFAAEIAALRASGLPD